MPMSVMRAFFKMTILGSLILITGCDKSPIANPVKSSEKEASETQKEQAPKEEGTKKEAKTVPQLLISAEELQKGIKQPKFQIIDARSSEDYQKGHLPLAIHIDLPVWKKKSLEKDGLADSKFWANAIGSLGITSDTHVVVYSTAAPNAARATWLLGIQGVKNVSILDGGWNQWKEISGKTTDQIPHVKRQDFKPSLQNDWVITTEQVQKNLKTLTVADSRSVMEYVGKGGKGKRKGHIPNAIRMEWSDLLNENGTYKSKENLQALLKDKGFTPDQSVITHCQTGGRASVNIIAFKLAGYPNIQNYYCGWSEWSADEALPIEVSKADSKK